MPLMNGDSEKAFNHNVAKLIREGHPRAQALAISYSIKRKASKNKKSKK